MIVGRTSAASITSAADAAQRLRAYQDAGADALFAVGVRSREDLDLIAAELELPLIVGGIGQDMMDREHLASRRVRLALQGHQPFAAAVQAVYDALKSLRNGTAPSELKRVASADLMNRLKRNREYQGRLEKFLQDK